MVELVVSTHPERTQTRGSQPSQPSAITVTTLTWQNCAMSSSVPGSWPANSLEGKPTTSRPLAWKSSYSFSRPVYCGV
jgi:hypothetical protein